ncbi:hypothetical protein JZO66_07630 [Enterococcus sp. DIV0242_7C1]|uniref:Lipoprotein n=1 Tax=Candidatus Enterococcus dunnyi TaxID=1834192 RepID=A0AAQ3W3M0_9ENTE|nr:hypothetical protein [Enterococcus sp. DIV0242_7C1]MBO0470412.1 hypothetical protein [Enterococcus sp. DIV0242_7C1]
MNFLKKSIKNTFILMSVSIVFTGCSGTNNKTALSSSTPTESSQLTTKQKEAIDHGYQIGEYKLLLTNNQKKEEEQIFIENNFFEANFQKKQGDIDFSKKINILLYALHYSPEDEMYTLGTFIVNTSDITIKKLRLTVTTNFKNIGDVSPTVLTLEGDDFAELSPKNFLTLSLSGDAPLDSADLLMENKGPDITFKTTDLEINGEKVDNLNED